jgi:hypothetical protein
MKQIGCSLTVCYRQSSGNPKKEMERRSGRFNEDGT